MFYKKSNFVEEIIDLFPKFNQGFCSLQSFKVGNDEKVITFDFHFSNARICGIPRRSGRVFGKICTIQGAQD